MKRLSILLLFVCSFCFSKAQSEPCTFVEAKPVWSKGRETEKNLFLSFREVIEVGRVEAATIRLTASCNYRLRVNGEFVGQRENEGGVMTWSNLDLERGINRIEVTSRGLTDSTVIEIPENYSVEL